MYHCHGQGTNQGFMLSIKHELRTHDELCLDAWDKKYPSDVHLERCHGGGGNQHWTYDEDAKTIKHKSPPRLCRRVCGRHSHVVVWFFSRRGLS